MRKRGELLVVCLWIVVALLFVVHNCKAEGWKVNTFIAGGYDQATWGSGHLVEPMGTLRNDNVFFHSEIQVRTDRFGLPWELQPTLAFFFQAREYDFSTSHAPIQKTSPRFYGGMLGLTKEFKWLTAYVVGGISYMETNLKMVEVGPGAVPHGQIKGKFLPIIEGGIYVPVKVYGDFTIAPYLGLEVWPTAPGFHRCRNFDMGHFNVLWGLALEYEL